MLLFKNVSKSYSQGDKTIEVLSDVNLSLDKGEIISVMGRSGSGKSTMLSLISGILKPDKGEIHLDGRSYTSLSETALTDLRAKNIGFIFQNFHLVSYLNALENIMLPAKVNGVANAEAKAMELLEKVGLKSRAEHLPSQLSGGEKQRVAIARALIHEPLLILADEPSGSLDDKTGEEVMDMLFDLVRSKGLSLILVTHSIKVANRCEKIFNFENKELVRHES